MAKRRYGLFERPRGTKRWTRVKPDISAPKETLLRAVQGWLIEGAFSETVEREIRPVK